MSNWEFVPTGSTHFREENGINVVVMTTKEGNTYKMEEQKNPIWWTDDRRLAVHQLMNSNDYLIEKTEGGTGLIFMRVGQMNFVKRAKEGTSDWNDAIELINGRSVQGY